MTNLTRLQTALCAILIAALAVLWNLHNKDVAAKAVAELKLRQADSTAQYYALAVDSLTKAFRVDTVVLTQEKKVYQAVHDTVLNHLTDTVVVREFVRVADSTISACDQALNGCEILTANLRLQLKATQDKVTALQGLRPSFLERHAGVLSVAVGALGFYLGTRTR